MASAQAAAPQAAAPQVAARLAALTAADGAAEAAAAEAGAALRETAEARVAALAQLGEVTVRLARRAAEQAEAGGEELLAAGGIGAAAGSAEGGGASAAADPAAGESARRCPRPRVAPLTRPRSIEPRSARCTDSHVSLKHETHRPARTEYRALPCSMLQLQVCAEILLENNDSFTHTPVKIQCQ